MRVPRIVFWATLVLVAVGLTLAFLVAGAHR
jgi:hypothetical protein